MNPSPPFRATCFCLGLAALALSGCRSSPTVSDIGVSSPPPPLVGSAPIVAYDDYARATVPAIQARIETVAQLGTR